MLDPDDTAALESAVDQTMREGSYGLPIVRDYEIPEARAVGLMLQLALVKRLDRVIQLLTPSEDPEATRG